VERSCDTLDSLPGDASRKQRVALSGTAASSDGARARISSLAEACGAVPKVNPAALAWALRAAFEADEHRRHDQTIELVWTGPSPEGTVLALGDDLKVLSEAYLWPLDRRPKDRAGRYGSLHAKFAMADKTALLVSSANLTEYALNLDMELGLLVRGGDLTGRVDQHLRRLVEERCSSQFRRA